MLDVHPPHSRMEGYRDFFLHLFTITIGLLIALSLEGLLEWRHHVHLVYEANTTLREEIEHNQKQLNDAATGLKHDRAEIEADLETLRTVQLLPPGSKPQKVSLGANFNSSSMRDTAWKTAQATGALSYMPYDQAQRYSDVYQMQDVYEHLQDQLSQDGAKFVGLIAKFGGLKTKGVTPEEASEIAEVLGQTKAHMTYVDIYVHVAIATNQALLDGKAAPTSYHENF